MIVEGSLDQPTFLFEDIMASTREDFIRSLEEVFAESERLGLSFVGLTAKALHQRAGGYPGKDHRMPVCCDVMRSVMTAHDSIVEQPPKGDGASLLIHYTLPRPRSA
jgi:hypothetical protein